MRLELLSSHQVFVIVDAKPRALGLPTDAYYAIEEVHDVSEVSYRRHSQLEEIETDKLIVMSLWS